jgi:hypothetical protein
MRTSTFVLPFVLLLSINSFSQDKEAFIVTDVTKLTFLNPGISYEKAIGKFQTLYGQAFMNTSISYSYSSSLGTNSDISFDPALTLQYRYYFNFKRREQAGKRTEMNNLNYIAPVFQTYFSRGGISSDYYNEQKRRAITAIGALWGIQRNYPKRFSLDLNLGLGYLFTKGTTLNNAGEVVKKNVGLVTALGQLNLGFWLNKRK